VTEILAVPGRILRIFCSTKLNCAGLVRKVDLLSISLGLKTVVLAEQSDQNSGRPGHNSFSLQSTEVLQKKIVQPNFAFFDQL
jgi:hypothetical protein